MQGTTRTSFVLPVPLLHRLHQTAQATNTSLSDLVRRLLEKGVAAQEQSTLTKTYAALERVRGISDANVQDVSATINETLYGENGAWKGVDE
jgi:predicted DNA-binding protein